MTMSPGEPGPTDFQGRTVPPYEGRQESADVDGDDEVRRGGANVGGATGPVESDERTAPEPENTPGGPGASPADERPAGDTPDGGSEEATVGPAHHPGTRRGEDVGDKGKKGRGHDGERNVGG